MHILICFFPLLYFGEIFSFPQDTVGGLIQNGTTYNKSANDSSINNLMHKNGSNFGSPNDVDKNLSQVALGQNLTTQRPEFAEHLRVRRQGNLNHHQNITLGNATNFQLNEENKDSTTPVPVRFHIDTEDESSKIEERGGQGQTQGKKSTGFLPFSLLETGVQTAQQAADKIEEFAKNQFSTLQAAVQPTAEKFKFPTKLGGLLFGGL